MNGKWGVIRGSGTSEERVGVEIIATPADDNVRTEKSAPAISMKRANLERMDDVVANEMGYKILANYLKNKAADVQEAMGLTGATDDTAIWKNPDEDGAEEKEKRNEMYKIWVELFAVPSFTPDVDDKWRMATLHTMMKRNRQAVLMLQKCVAEVEESNPQRNMIFFDFARSLMRTDRFSDAVDAIAEIKIEDGDAQRDYLTKIKGGALMQVSSACDKESLLPVKERALRGFLELQPDNGSAMEQLGTVLCNREEYEEGVKYYELALKSGKTEDGQAYDPPGLRKYLEMAKVLLKEQKDGPAKKGCCSGCGKD